MPGALVGLAAAVLVGVVVGFAAISGLLRGERLPRGVETKRPPVTPSRLVSSSSPIPRRRKRRPIHVVADLHCDTLYRIYDRPGYSLSRPRTGRNSQVDLGSLRRGGVNLQVFAAWIPDSRAGAAATRFADLLIDALYRQVGINSRHMALCRTVRDIGVAVSAGRLAAISSIEGGHALGHGRRILANIDHFFHRGVRMISLTWNNSSALATSAADASRGRDGGLTPIGCRAVARMMDLGILVDVSHASNRSALDTLRIALAHGAPVVASHSDCYAIQPVYRNASDAVIRGIDACGGVIGINFHSPFVGSGPVGIADLLKHVDHIRALTGSVRCIALGSDFDGGTTPVRGLSSPARLESLVRELRRHGYTGDEVDAIMGENFMRCMARAEAAARKAEGRRGGGWVRPARGTQRETIPRGSE